MATAIGWQASVATTTSREREMPVPDRYNSTPNIAKPVYRLISYR